MYKTKSYSWPKITLKKYLKKWSGYVTLPLDIIDAHITLFMKRWKYFVSENISFYLGTVHQRPTLGAFLELAFHPEQYPVAKQYTQGILALMRYKILRNFHLPIIRVEGIAFRAIPFMLLVFLGVQDNFDTLIFFSMKDLICFCCIFQRHFMSNDFGGV